MRIGVCDDDDDDDINNKIIIFIFLLVISIKNRFVTKQTNKQKLFFNTQRTREKDKFYSTEIEKEKMILIYYHFSSFNHHCNSTHQIQTKQMLKIFS